MADGTKLTYSVKEAAAVLGISKSLLYRELQSGVCDIPYHKVGQRILIGVKALEEYVNNK